jgi:hypothetical protein
MVVSRETRKWLEGRLTGLKRPVTLAVFSQEQEDAACYTNRELAETLAELSPKIMVEVSQFMIDKSARRKYGVDYVPALVVASKDGTLARFYGGVAGYGLAALVEAIKAASLGPELSEPTRQWLSGLGSDLRLDLFTTPDDPVAPELSALCCRLGIQSAWVFASIFNLKEYPQLAVFHNVKTLPSLFANGALVAESALPEGQLLAALKGAGGKHA